jgi:endonuclease/exonuclease/phosphatase (EEP) superfamily protein YafD
MPHPANTPPLRQRLRQGLARRARNSLIAVTVAALVGWTGGWHWLPELFSHFFIQYALLLLLLLPGNLLAWRRNRGAWAALAVTALGACAVAVAPFWLPAPTATPAATAPRLRLLQFNAAQNTTPLLRWLAQHRQDVDVIVVLEADPAFVADMNVLAADFPHHIERLDDSPFSIALISRYPLRDAHVLDLIGADFPAVYAKIDMDSASVRLFGIHPPPPLGGELAQLRNRYMNALADQLTKEGAEAATLVAGDFNSTIWSPRLRDFMTHAGLEDAQRGQGAPGTWPAITARYSGLLGIPIDLTLISPDLGIVNRRAGSFPGSDHLPVFTEIAFQP